ncbi:hypothetical protein ACHAXR_010129 [Thalassiosira sp. AJA248-18]
MASENLCHPSTAADVLLQSTDTNDCEIPLESLRESFRNDGFVLFHHALSPSFVSTLQARLEEVLRGQFNRNSPPDKIPKLLMNSNKIKKHGKNTNNGIKKESPLGYDGKSQNSRVLQIINIHKCDKDFRELAISPEIGRMVAELAGWEHGARLAQDQVWAKPPGAPPLVFHRDSPYFMFTPSDVVTVWVALDDMDEDLGPLEYVKGSHTWGDGRVGTSSSFFQSENRKLLYSAAKLEGIENPESTLEIISMAGLEAGGISIHHGKVWHGSGKNRSKDRPRRGVGLHFVPAEVKFTIDARKSKLWRSYVPDDVNDEDVGNAELSEDHFPLVWNRPR